MPRRDETRGEPSLTQDTADGMIAVETVERCVGTRLSREDSDVIVEGYLVITARGERMVSLAASPAAWDELALGFLFFHGVTVGRGDILSVSIGDGGRGAIVDIDASPEAVRRALGRGGDAVVTDDHRTMTDAAFERVGEPTGGAMTPERIFSLMRLLEAHSAVHDRTHGSHIALLVDGERAVAARSDISRRNAIDKAAGFALINDIPTRGLVLLTSGRVASDIVARARLMGVSALISRAAATDRGVEAAREAGLLLVGMVRDGSFLVYSGLGRVGVSPESR
jgi:FdhD protein